VTIELAASGRTGAIHSNGDLLILLPRSIDRLEDELIFSSNKCCRIKWRKQLKLQGRTKKAGVQDTDDRRSRHRRPEIKASTSGGIDERRSRHRREASTCRGIEEEEEIGTTFETLNL
jgi:hypothetical protein